MKYAFDLDQIENWAYWDNVFSSEECDLIISLANNKKKEEALINPENSLKNNLIRKSNVVWMEESSENNWIYEKLIYVVNNLKERYFKFNLFGFTEQLQFTEYNAPDGKYVYHIDRGKNMIPRKLSLVVQLTNPEKYEGGDLELWFENEPIKAKKEQGSVILFPSYTLHQVKPVTKGTRNSLVSWIGGKPFK